MRWGEAVTTEFVRMYLKHECLWNPDHPSYKMRHVREKAYYAISSEFKAATSKNLSVPEVKVKIKNLRTTYCQQVHKILQKSGPDSMYEPSLVWFHEMDRCLKHIPLNRHLNYGSRQQAPEVDSSEIWVETRNEKLDEQNPDPLISQTDEELQEPSDEVNTKKKKRSSFKKKKKFKRKSPVCYVSDSNSESREDEFDIYGKFIASQLRQMDLQKALRLQLEIQSLVSEARISDIS
ncbi:uncharacterized protein LOC126373875 [Pectinophora gossypiella]|uniref:uncharacterized protein LOC126373875 n=1 Tax=Pectinophora gossypiella TaxID=13191 RepID=UPI00214EC556|nr:uncharacterized protein LOC126373875 [Pectinophora gossypiella]